MSCQASVFWAESASFKKCLGNIFSEGSYSKIKLDGFAFVFSFPVDSKRHSLDFQLYVSTMAVL